MADTILDLDEYDPKRGVDYVKDPIYHYVHDSHLGQAVD
jgi:hypothetical protein